MSLSIEEVIKGSDELHNELKHDEIIKFINENVKGDHENVEIIWRLARAYYNQNDIEENKNTKLEYIRKAIDLLNSVIENNEHAEVYKWWAICTSGLGDYVTATEKIKNAPLIKEHALKSLDLKPNDTITLYLLGSWSYKVSSISWIERNIANVLFGKVPEASYSEALEYFLRVYENEPLFIRNVSSIADTYYQLGQYDNAKKYYSIASKMIPKNSFENKFVEEAKKKC